MTQATLPLDKNLRQQTDANSPATPALSARTYAGLDLPKLSKDQTPKAESCGGAPAKGTPCFHALYTTLATFRGSGLPLPKGVTPQLYQELGGKVGAWGGC